MLQKRSVGRLLVVTGSLNNNKSRITLVRLVGTLPRRRCGMALMLLSLSDRCTCHLGGEIGVIRLAFGDSFTGSLISVCTFPTGMLGGLSIGCCVPCCSFVTDEMAGMFRGACSVTVSFCKCNSFIATFLTAGVRTGGGTA